jgi:hypothetical protein
VRAVAAVRAGLVLGGAAVAGYGGWLVWPHLPAAWTWLIAGPILHDTIVAPAVGVAGLALGRLVSDPNRRAWAAAGLATSAVLALVAVPLLWRPEPAPLNPGLHDRHYGLGLAVALLVVWIGAALGAASRGLRRSRPARSTRPPSSTQNGGR